MRHTSHNPKQKLVQAIGYMDQDVDTSIRSTLFIRTGTEHVFDNVFEMCGGNARVSILLNQGRHYQAGPNFDA
eukprot:8533899-Prorocentrum_lima.AAC.1